jgi:hypothetical protein
MKQPFDLELFICQLRKRQEELLADYDDVNAALAEIERQIRTAELVRTSYQRHFKLPVVEAPSVNPTLRDKYARLTIKEMLIVIGSEAGGILELSDARKILIQAGIFKDDRNAATSMAPIISRHEEVFKRVARGRYILLIKQTDCDEPVPHVRTPKTMTVYMAPTLPPLPKIGSAPVTMRIELQPTPRTTVSLFGHSEKT